MAPESSKLAECVGEVRALLRRILSENRPAAYVRKQSSPHTATAHAQPRYVQLSRQIADECYTAFVACFHAFYPTSSLKWACLCDLLNLLDPVSGRVCDEWACLCDLNLLDPVSGRVCVIYSTYQIR